MRKISATAMERRTPTGTNWTFIIADYGCQNTEKSVSLTDSDVQTLLIGEENQKTERKTERYVIQWLW